MEEFRITSARWLCMHSKTDIRSSRNYKTCVCENYRHEKFIWNCVFLGWKKSDINHKYWRITVYGTKWKRWHHFASIHWSFCYFLRKTKTQVEIFFEQPFVLNYSACYLVWFVLMITPSDRKKNEIKNWKYLGNIGKISS